METLLANIKALSQRKLVLDVLWLGLSKVCVIFTGLFGLRLLTELASPQIFGEANLIIGVLGLGLHFCAAPFLQSVLRLYPKAHSRGEASIFLNLILKSVFLSVLFLALIFFIIFKLGLLEGMPSVGYGLYFLIIGYLLGSALKGILQSMLNSMRDQKFYSLWYAAEAMLMLTFACLFLWWKPTAISYVAGHTVAIIFILCIAFSIMKSQKLIPEGLRSTLFKGHGVSSEEGKVKSDLWRDIYTFGSPFIVFALMGWLTGMFDRYYLASQFSFYEAGKYVAIFSIASRLPMLPANVLNEAFRPLIYQAAIDNDWVKWRKAGLPWLGVLILSGTFMVLCVYFFGPFIASILLAEEYREGAGKIMLILTGSFAALSLTQAVELMILSIMNSSKLLIPKMCSAIGTVTLCFILIPPYGFVGAGFSSLGGQVILFLATTITLLFHKRLISQ